MPLSRFLVDLDQLLAAFQDGGGADGRNFDNLRLAVARLNEIRRQLAIAEEKLGAALSMAEVTLMDGGGPEAPAAEAGDRFHLYDHCRTGIEEIDEGHESLIAIGNRLFGLAYGNEAPVETVLEGLRELLAEMRSHFDLEEVRMDGCGYPGADEHRIVHRRMYDYLAEMLDLGAGGPLLVAIRLEYLLGSWLVWHMQRDDRDFVRYLAEMQGELASRRASSFAN